MEKPLKVAAWAGLISLILSLVVTPFILLTDKGILQSIVSIGGSIGGGLLGIFFLYGFVILGKKFKSTLLNVMAWIGVAFAILALLFGLLGGILNLTTNVSAQESAIGNTNNLDANSAIFGLVLLFMIFWIPIALVFGAYTILFGIGIMRLEGNVRYAKPAGIINIIAGATYIILIGLVIRMVAFAFEVALLFDASRKFEK